LSPSPVEYTGMENPDVVIISSGDGLKELQANGTLARCRAETLLLLDAELDEPRAQGRVLRLPLRRSASAQRAALAGLAAWLALSSALPPTAWEAALATLPPDRRADPSEALQVGAGLVKDLAQ